MRSYTARVSREGKWWVVHVPDVEGATTQARRLGDVEDMARDMLATMLDVDPADVGIDVRVEDVGGVHVGQLADDLASTRSELEDAQAEYSRRLRDAARLLADEHLAVRDIGAILGVSHQRAQQLLTTGS